MAYICSLYKLFIKGAILMESFSDIYKFMEYMKNALTQYFSECYNNNNGTKGT